MSEPRYISPMLDGFSLGQSISDHHGVECYPAMRDDSDKRYIVKKISLPASQVQVEALLLTGVFRDPDAVLAYYEELAHGVRREVITLNTLAEQRGFVPCEDCQIVPMEDGVGFEVHILSRYRKSLDRYTHRESMTHLSAVNLGIDLCAAMAVCREAGWLYVDLKPENIYLFGGQEYRIGDLGFVAMDSLQYASLPDRYRSVYTAPEVADAYASLNATMDTYALGMVLYQIYNNGKLPFDGPEARQNWLDRLAAGESLEPPCCADEEMAGIILKACSYSPADRWQTPAEMGHALISYMQRNDVDDVPIVPPAEPEPVSEEPDEEAPADEIPVEAENTSADEMPAETQDASDDETPAETEDASDDETPAETEDASDGETPVETMDVPVDEIPAEAEDTPVDGTPVETEEVPADEAPAESEDVPVAETPADGEDTAEDGGLDNLIDAILSDDPEPVTEPDAEDAPAMVQFKKILEEDMAKTPEELSADTAEYLRIAEELIEHEPPAPVVVPEPIDVPIPDPILPEPEENAEEAPDAESSEPAADSGEESSDEPDAAETTQSAPSIWKKLFKSVTAIVLAAGLAFGAWYYYQNIYLQTIDSMEYDGNATSVTITVSTAMDQSKLTVLCKDTYGNAVTGILENGVVTFSDLVPGSQYIITLEPQGFHALKGTTSVTYSTPAETKLMHLNAVTGQEAGSAILSFGIEGPDSEQWILTYSAADLEPQTVTFTGHSVTVNELTLGTEYTFTLTAPEGIQLVGEHVITHTPGELVQASNLTLSEYAAGVITLSWNAPEGVERWIVRCTDGAGYDQILEVTGNTASFEGVTEGARYTVEVTAANMTLGIRTEVVAEVSSISGFTAQLNDNTVELSWNTAAANVPWTIECSADGKVLQILTTEENKAVFGPVAPGTAYTFTISSGEMPGATTTVETAAAGTFRANKLDQDSIIVEMFDVPSKSNWSYGTLLRAKEKDTFKSGGSLALLYTVTRPYSYDKAEFETIFVIRDSEGKLVSTSARTRVWDNMWDNGYCTEQVSNLPAVKGTYTLSIFIENGLLAELPFTIQ